MSKRKTLAVATGIAAIAALCGTLACSSPTSSSATVTEVFSGTLQQGGAQSYPFNQSKDGSVTLTLTKLDPDSSAAVEVGLGQLLATSTNTAGCSITTATFSAAVNAPVSFGGIPAGTYCAVILDYGLGVLTQTNTFSISIAHS